MTPKPASSGHPSAQLLGLGALRARAELAIAQSSTANPGNPSAVLTPDALRTLLHELQVHQIELEMQNEELRRAKEQIEISNARYFELYDLAPVGYCVASESGLVLDANLTMATLLGQTRGALAKQPVSRFIAREDQDIYYRLRQELLADPAAHAADAKPALCELRMVKGDGTQVWVLVTASVAPEQAMSAESRKMQLRLTVTDISARKESDAKIQLAASVFAHAREGIMVTLADGDIVDVNDAYTRITGYSHQESVGRNPRMLRSGRQGLAFYEAMWRDLKNQGHWSGEIWNRRKTGEVFAALQTIGSVKDAQGETRQYVSLFSDITAIKDHQIQLEHMAHFDSLTSLPNRVLLADRLLQGVAHATRVGNSLAVGYLDLDGFKGVNDRYGHEVGDQLLIALTRNMKEILREGDTLARVGGDEFVVVLTDMVNPQACLPIFTRLLEAASEQVKIADQVLRVSASMGVTFYPQTYAIEPDQLVRQADQAMYQAKVTGRNRYHVFDAALDSTLRVHHEDLHLIELALERREFVLYYQPKVNMRTGQVIGAEALIRWQHPEKGLLSPFAFLPVIEEHPLAVAIGEWVIDTALGQIEQWRRSGLDLPVSVNIGARQLQQVDFVERLQAILAAHPQVDPTCLELEILETSALKDFTQVSRVIEACEHIGIVFALDDFGTGYSSLTYLRRLRVATLKIDQSFVCDMLQDPDDLAILKGVIGLAAAFRRGVIAEGVETIAHGTALLQLGCDMAQGYGISRPMPALDLPAWVTTWQPDAQWRAAPQH